MLQRARVDQRLHFDSGVLFPAVRRALRVIFSGGYEVPQDKLDPLFAALDLLETFLQNDNYLVGNSVTLADFCCAPTVITMELVITFDVDKYPKILEWIERLNELPYFVQHNAETMKEFQFIFQNRIEANKAAAVAK